VAEEWITTKEAAEILGVTQDHVSYLLRKGVIQGRKIRRDWVTTCSAVEAYKATGPKPGPKAKDKT
jgi:excisionase family DNA binding protein